MFQLSLYAGWNFVHIPLEVTQVNGESMSIETLGNLFQVLMPAHMYVHDGNCWIEVFGDSEQALGTNQGVVVYMDAPLTVNLVGSPAGNLLHRTWLDLRRLTSSVRWFTESQRFPDILSGGLCGACYG